MQRERKELLDSIDLYHEITNENLGKSSLNTKHV